MTHDRSYRPARPAIEAISEVVRQAGRQFDPGLVPMLVEQVQGGGHAASLAAVAQGGVASIGLRSLDEEDIPSLSLVSRSRGR